MTADSNLYCTVLALNQTNPSVCPVSKCSPIYCSSSVQQSNQHSYSCRMKIQMKPGSIKQASQSMLMLMPMPKPRAPFSASASLYLCPRLTPPSPTLNVDFTPDSPTSQHHHLTCTISTTTTYHHHTSHANCDSPTLPLATSSS